MKDLTLKFVECITFSTGDVFKVYVSNKQVGELHIYNAKQTTTFKSSSSKIQDITIEGDHHEASVVGVLIYSLFGSSFIGSNNVIVQFEYLP